ncbi:hypothetical protein [Paenibacillus odorifer]|uniref:hypothetical protein n=1 Tax=Paenibacillus odorifer TaxID=189426 RepID=UPI0011157532|nr:hypothetical protein [Paenibacillus odorifer]
MRRIRWLLGKTKYEEPASCTGSLCWDCTFVGLVLSNGNISNSAGFYIVESMATVARPDVRVT